LVPLFCKLVPLARPLYRGLASAVAEWRAARPSTLIASFPAYPQPERVQIEPRHLVIVFSFTFALHRLTCSSMDHSIERKYFLERTADFVRALEEQTGDLHMTEDNRILFRVSGRPFEALAWISEEYDLMTVTTRTAELPAAKFEEAVNILQTALQICWDHCVAVQPAENRYDLSMALFVGGYTFEAFEGVVYNLLACSEAIEDTFKVPTTKKKKS